MKKYDYAFQKSKFNSSYISAVIWDTVGASRYDGSWTQRIRKNNVYTDPYEGHVGLRGSSQGDEDEP